MKQSEKKTQDDDKEEKSIQIIFPHELDSKRDLFLNKKKIVLFEYFN